MNPRYVAMVEEAANAIRADHRNHAANARRDGCPLCQIDAAREEGRRQGLSEAISALTLARGTVIEGELWRHFDTVRDHILARIIAPKGEPRE